MNPMDKTHLLNRLSGIGPKWPNASETKKQPGILPWGAGWVFEPVVLKTGRGPFPLVLSGTGEKPMLRGITGLIALAACAILTSPVGATIS
jgi:hypothetical protein